MRVLRLEVATDGGPRGARVQGRAEILGERRDGMRAVQQQERGPHAEVVGVEIEDGAEGAVVVRREVPARAQRREAPQAMGRVFTRPPRF